MDQEIQADLRPSRSDPQRIAASSGASRPSARSARFERNGFVREARPVPSMREPFAAHEVGNDVHENIAIRQARRHGWKRLPRGAFPEHARATERLQRGREHLRGARGQSVDQDREWPAERFHGNAGVGRATWVRHETHLLAARPHDTQRARLIQEVAGRAHHHPGHTARISAKVKHDAGAVARGITARSSAGMTGGSQ